MYHDNKPLHTFGYIHKTLRHCTQMYSYIQAGQLGPSVDVRDAMLGPPPSRCQLRHTQRKFSYTFETRISILIDNKRWIFDHVRLDSFSWTFAIADLQLKKHGTIIRSDDFDRSVGSFGSSVTPMMVWDFWPTDGALTSYTDSRIITRRT